jgi:hypothetical protein
MHVVPAVGGGAIVGVSDAGGATVGLGGATGVLVGATATPCSTEIEMATGSLAAPAALYARTMSVCVPGVAFQVWIKLNAG